jgi:hypothetical protein
VSKLDQPPRNTLDELYPVNPLQLARYRETFCPGGAKDDRPDADLLSEPVY